MTYSNYFDPFNDDPYGGIIHDFRLGKIQLTFRAARLQQFTQEYYLFLADVSSWLGVIPRYKPNDNRLPRKVFMLLKTEDYVMNLKNGEGKWSKVVIPATPIEKWFIGHWKHAIEPLITEGMTVMGTIELDNSRADFSSIAVEQKPSDFFIMGTSIVPSNGLVLPDGTLKLTKGTNGDKVTNSSSNGSNGPRSSKKALTSEDIASAYERAFDSAYGIHLWYYQTKNHQITENELIQLRMEIFKRLINE